MLTPDLVIRAEGRVALKLQLCRRACQVSPRMGLKGFFQDWNTCCRPAVNQVATQRSRSTGSVASTAMFSSLRADGQHGVSTSGCTDREDRMELKPCLRRPTMRWHRKRVSP